MAHPQLRPQYNISEPASISDWYSSQAMNPEFKSTVVAQPNHQMVPELHLQLQASRQENLGVGHSLEGTETHSAYRASNNNAWQANTAFMYPSMAMQSAEEKAQIQHEGQLSWYSPMHGKFSRGVSTNGSDIDTNSSLSPKSLYSDMVKSEILPFSSTPASDLPTQVKRASRSPSMFMPKQSNSPGSTGSSQSKGPIPTDQIQIPAQLSWAGLVPSCGNSVLPLGVHSDVGHGRSDVPRAMDFGLRYNPGMSIPHGTNQVSMNWPPDDYLSGSFVSAQSHSDVTHAPAVNNTLQVLPSSIASSGSQLADWDGPRTNYSSQYTLQDCFQAVSATDETRRIREDDDRILIEGKRAGLTYKEIRKKMHNKPAESTLRGRYRSLTKDRKDRVRKPVWTKRDLELLNEAVLKELDRIDGQQYPALTYDQQLLKVSWKKIADTIVKKGGSYHFGNSTCKKKWLQIESRR